MKKLSLHGAEQPWSDELQDLKDISLEKALASGNLEDLERAASIWKLAAERRKQVVEATNSYRVIRYEGFKTWATLIVPFLTLVTLAITVWVQTGQLSATREALNTTREANEDTQFREAVKTFSGKENDAISGVAANTLLKPFLESRRYKTQAREMGYLLLSRIVSLDGFEDLFNAVIGTASWENLDTMVQIDRNLYSIFNEYTSLLDDLDQQQKEGRTARSAMAVPLVPFTPTGAVLEDNGARGRPTFKQQLTHARDQVIEELSFVGNKIGEVMRTTRPEGYKLDLSNTLFYKCNLSGADLRQAVLTKAALQSVELTGARISGSERYTSSNWSDTQWWKAGDISAPLLAMLKENYWPYFAKDTDYGDDTVTREDYVLSLNRLCKSVGLDCPTNSVKFGTPKRRPS